MGNTTDSRPENRKIVARMKDGSGVWFAVDAEFIQEKPSFFGYGNYKVTANCDLIKDSSGHQRTISLESI